MDGAYHVDDLVPIRDGPSSDLPRELPQLSTPQESANPSPEGSLSIHDHLLYEKFARLTRVEKSKSVYEETSRIGTREG